MSTKWWTERFSPRKRPARIALALLLAAATASASGCSLLPPEDEEEVLPTITPPQLSEKPTYEVTTGTLETKLQGIGELKSMTEEELFFTSDADSTAGGFRIKDIYVEAGQQVQAGELIAELDVSEKQRELRRAKLEFRQDELDMIQVLRKADEYEPEELEQLKIDFELKRTTILELEEAIANAQLTAPFDGTIVSVSKKRGDTVEAYDPIAVIADLSELVVAAEYSKANLESIAVGMEAIVSINAFGEHRGKVWRLPTAPDDQNQNPDGSEEDSIDNYLLVELDGALPEGATRGTPLSVSVITNRKENAIVIPPVALRSYNGRSYVQVVDAEGNKREVDVEVGMQTPTQVEILKGLEPGQKVVGK